jgi:thioredoxin-dependent peroxiredoxin
MSLVVGRMAPNFTLPTDTGEPLTLKSLRGQWVVVFCYPQDDTPACTAEACAFRDAWSDFEALGAVVLGLSPDSVARHQRFKAKHALPYTLLADEDHRALEKWGVWAEKKLYGRVYMGVVRTTVIIDPAGRVAKVFEKVKVAGHIEDVATELRRRIKRRQPAAIA